MGLARLTEFNRTGTTLAAMHTGTTCPCDTHRAWGMPLGRLPNWIGQQLPACCDQRKLTILGVRLHRGTGVRLHPEILFEIIPESRSPGFPNLVRGEKLEEISTSVASTIERDDGAFHFAAGPRDPGAVFHAE